MARKPPRHEQTHEGEYPLRCLHVDPDAAPSALLVLFSGFNRPFDYRYNYVRALDGTRFARRYLLDDLGPRGSYYLGTRRDFMVERSVVAMVDRELASLGLTRADVVAVGSSKGGSAALYYCLRHGWGRAVAGGPQVFVGSYLCRETRFSDVAALIAGGSTEADVRFLDALIPDAVVESSHRPRLQLFTSEGDRHHQRHLGALLRLLDELDRPYEVVWGSYSPHAAIGTEFSEYLARELGSGSGRD